MSIYGSFGDISADEPAIGAPLVYRGSHVFPDPDRHETGGHVDLGLINRFIRPDGHDHDGDGDEDEVWPFLRLAVRGEPTYRDDFTDTVVLTGRQAQYLRDQLTVWLAQAGVEPGDWRALHAANRDRWGTPW